MRDNCHNKKCLPLTRKTSHIWVPLQYWLLKENLSLQILFLESLANLYSMTEQNQIHVVVKTRDC